MTLKASITAIIFFLTYQTASAAYYCTINSSFEGVFGGGGWTKLEAQTNAKQACRVGSRENGRFCSDLSITCESTADSDNGSNRPSYCPEQRERFYCTITSSFEGVFGGGGLTQLEARTKAKQACRVGSRENGRFCSDLSITCESTR